METTEQSYATAREEAAWTRAEAAERRRQSEEEPEEEPTQKRGPGKLVAIVLLSLLLVGSLVGNYFLFDDNTELADAATRRQGAEQKQLAEVLAAKTAVESKLAETQTLLSNYQSEGEQGRQLLEAANAEIARKKRAIGQLWKIKADLAAFKTQLSQAKTYGDSLETQIKALGEELTQVKSENANLKATIEGLNTEKSSMQSKIQSAAGLQATTVKFEAQQARKGDKFDVTDRAKRTNRLTISFELIENKLAAAGKRNLHVVVTAPTGEILGAGDETFTIQPSGKTSAFTRNKIVNYPEEGGKVFINWDGTEQYPKGAYQLEVFCDGRQIGTTQLTLK